MKTKIIFFVFVKLQESVTSKRTLLYHLYYHLELSQEAYSNVDDEEKEKEERNLLTTHNDQLNNSEDERELRKKRRIEYSSTSNNIHQQTELV